MYGYIYETTNLVDNKKYIGQHKAERFEPENYIGSGILLLKAIKKYGKDNFSCRLLEACNSKEELNEAEKRWIKEFNADNSDEYYNIAEGGEGHTCDPWNKGIHQPLHPNSKKALDYGRHLPSSEKQRMKLSEYRNSVIVSIETKNKLRSQQKGRICVNNGFINTFIKPEFLELYYSQGWRVGMDKNLSRFKERQEKRNQYRNSKKFND